MARGSAVVRSLVTAALVTAGLAVAAAPAEASPCATATSGVTVVIDNGSSIKVACAPGSPSSAVAALQAVASVTPVARYGYAVVCRINGYPASDQCQVMPPTTAYWAFYTAPRGGTWSYAPVGVTEDVPPPGSVIGFAFGASPRPGIAPPAPGPKPTRPPAPPPSVPARTSTPTPPVTPRTSQTTSRPVVAPPTSRTPPRPAPTTPAPSVSPSAGAIAAANMAARSGSGGPLRLGLTALLLVALGGAAAIALRRRRRAG